MPTCQIITSVKRKRKARFAAMTADGLKWAVGALKLWVNIINHVKILNGGRGSDGYRHEGY
jgi:hypothetical protein